MSFKVIKEFLSQFNPLHVGDIGKVLDELEKDYKLKFNALNNLLAGEITIAALADFKRRYYFMLDVQDELTVLKHTFSHDAATLKVIEKLEENLEAQNRQIASKNTNFEVLQSKLNEEREILAIEEELFKKTKQKAEPQQINASFENLQFEPVSSKENMTFDKSLQSLRERGYERHLRPQEAFAIIIAYLEKKLSSELDNIVQDMQISGEWLSCAFEIKGVFLYVYLDPEGLVYRGEKYVKQDFSCSEERIFNIKGIHLQERISIKDLPAGLIPYFYGKKFENLPKKLQDSEFFLPSNNVIRPVGRDIYNGSYFVDCVCFDVRASRGVVVGKKIVK